MKKNFRKKVGLIVGGLCLIIIVAVGYVLGTDAYISAKFRTSYDPIATNEKVDLTGLRELRVSGGPAVDFPDLKKKLGAFAQHILIVDGIKTYHGYIEETPVIFFGYHRPDASDIRHYLRRLFCTGTVHMRRELVESEEKAAKRHGCDYQHIAIHNGDPNHDESVDTFVSLVDNLPQGVWPHFHCRYGHGRTSMLLVMFDIMKNAPQVSLQDIVKRQVLLGSVDLFDLSPWVYSTYSSHMLQVRKKFIEDFYKFIAQRKAGGAQKWSEWRKNSVAEKE